MYKWIISLMVGLIVTVSLACYSDQVQADLASHVLRFHVIANSDSAEDQAVKLKVRDRVISEFKDDFSMENGIDQVKQLAKDKILDITKVCENELALNGFSYTVKVEVGKSSFPTKVYGNITLPAGTYDALRIIIGKGEGKNWWCVLFPPLCFVDESHAQMPNKSLATLSESLPSDEYNMVVNEKRENEMPVEIKFKIVEFFQNTKANLQTAHK